jgi:undecaprenol kinase
MLVGLGLAIEYLNTAIEYTVDLMTDKHHLLAKHAKDCAAAGMLIFSVFASIISTIIFLPEIILWLSI